MSRRCCGRRYSHGEKAGERTWGRNQRKTTRETRCGCQSTGIVLSRLLQHRPHTQAQRWVSPILQLRKLRLADVFGVSSTISERITQGSSLCAVYLCPPPTTPLSICPMVLPSCSQPINKQVITVSPPGAYQHCGARKCFLMPCIHLHC